MSIFSDVSLWAATVFKYTFIIYQHPTHFGSIFDTRWKTLKVGTFKKKNTHTQSFINYVAKNYDMSCFLPTKKDSPLKKMGEPPGGKRGEDRDGTSFPAFQSNAWLTQRPWSIVSCLHVHSSPISCMKNTHGKKGRCFVTLPKTNSSPLKMDGWNTFSFPFGAQPIFRDELLVSGRVSSIKFGINPPFFRFMSNSRGPLFRIAQVSQGQKALLPSMKYSLVNRDIIMVYYNPYING